jgi:hypothetical protein
MDITGWCTAYTSTVDGRVYGVHPSRGDIVGGCGEDGWSR